MDAYPEVVVAADAYLAELELEDELYDELDSDEKEEASVDDVVESS